MPRRPCHRRRSEFVFVRTAWRRNAERGLAELVDDMSLGGEIRDLARGTAVAILPRRRLAMRSKKLAVVILAAASLTLGAQSANAQAAFRGTFAGPRSGASFRSGGFANHRFATRGVATRGFEDWRFGWR